MDFEYLKKSEVLQKHNKIFSSLFNLTYRNNKIEAKFQKLSEIKYDKTFFTFTFILMFKSLFLTIFEGILYCYFPKTKSRNLQYNFMMCLGITFLSTILFVSNLFMEKQKSKIYKYVSMFALHFLIEKLFLSIISIVIVYFEFGIEIVSFTFLMKIITNFCISLFVFRKFTITIFILVINTVFNYVFLLKIHVIKAILYYIVTDTAFLLIKISFVYMFEYLTRMYFYSFIRLAREKEYILETLNSFNVSYFMSFNYDIIDHTRLNNILKQDNSKNGKIILKDIEKLFHEIVSVDNPSPEIEDYFSELIKNKQSFKFKKLIAILKNSNDGQTKFMKFTNFATFRLKNEMNEYFYVQLYLKIKIKGRSEETTNNLLFFLGDTEYEETEGGHSGYYNDVKIEGIFLDITQSYLKKETHVNSSLLSKYIRDIKMPLCLLDMIINYNKKFSPIRLIDAKLENNKKITFGPNSPIRNQNIILSSGNDEQLKYMKIVFKTLLDTIAVVDNFSKRQIIKISDNKSNYDLVNEYSSQKVNLRKLITSCINFFQIYVKFNPNKKNLKLIAEIDQNIPNYIKSNKLSLHQVIMNLISNALKFTYCGEVKVICKLKSKTELEEKQYIEIVVIDNGVGIEHHNLAILSKPFCLATNRKGPGFGLNIVNEILQELDSKLTIHSVKNKGSSFSFVLPVDLSLCFNEFELDLNSRKSSSPDSSIYIENRLLDNKEDCIARKMNQSKANKCENINNQGNVDSKNVINDKSTIQKNLDKLINQPQESENENENFESNEFESLDSSETDSAEIRKKLLADKKIEKPKVPYLFHTNGGVNKWITTNTVLKTVQNSINRENAVIPNIDNIIQKKSLKSFNNLNRNLDFHILIVNNNSNFRQNFEDKILTISSEFNNLKVNIKCSSCMNPLEAINIIYESFKQQLYFDFILCDENMPFMTGSNFVRLYKTMLAPEGLYPVKFGSLIGDSLKNESEREVKNQNYFDYFLDKSFKKEEIILIIRDIILS